MFAMMVVILIGVALIDAKLWTIVRELRRHSHKLDSIVEELRRQT